MKINKKKKGKKLLKKTVKENHGIVINELNFIYSKSINKYYKIETYLKIQNVLFYFSVSL